MGYEGHRDGWKGLTIYYRGGNIIPGHIPVGCLRKPLQRHLSCQLHIRAPACAPIDRGDEASIELTGRVRTVGIRKVIVGECEMCLATSSVFIDSDASSKMINAAADRIDGNTLYRCPGHAIS